MVRVKCLARCVLKLWVSRADPRISSTQDFQYTTPLPDTRKNVRLWDCSPKSQNESRRGTRVGLYYIYEIYSSYKPESHSLTFFHGYQERAMCTGNSVYWKMLSPLFAQSHCFAAFVGLAWDYETGTRWRGGCSTPFPFRFPALIPAPFRRCSARLRTAWNKNVPQRPVETEPNEANKRRR